MKLAEVLGELSGQLIEADASFAVIGGLAASARGEARFTRDIDLALAVEKDEQAERYIFLLNQVGYQVLRTVEQDATQRLATARLRHPSGAACDLVFATSGIEQEVIDSADAIEVFPSQHLPTASAEAMLAMKTLSASSRRPQDSADIQAIIRTHPAFSEERVMQLLETIETRGFARGQALLEKWQTLRRDLKV